MEYEYSSYLYFVHIYICSYITLFIHFISANNKLHLNRDLNNINIICSQSSKIQDTTNVTVVARLVLSFLESSDRGRSDAQLLLPLRKNRVF